MKLAEDYFTMDKITNDYLKEIQDIPLLTKKEEKELGRKIQNGDKSALEKLTYHNLRLVPPIAAKMARKSTRSFLDICQDGNMGLIKAAKNFDVEKGAAFSTFAVPSIRNEILNAIRYTDSMIPKKVDGYIQFYRKIKQINAILTQELGRDPTIKDIACKLDVPEEKIETVFRDFDDVISLQEVLVNEKTRTEVCLMDIITYEDAESVEDAAIKNVEKERVRKLVEELPEKERVVIERLYGFKNYTPVSIRKLVPYLNIGKSRVDQLEKKARQKLKEKMIEEKKYTK